MIFLFWKNARRRKLFNAPIEQDERLFATNALWQFARLNAAWQDHAIRWCRIFIREKYFEGCNGFQVTEPVKWSVAMSAAMCVPPGVEWYFDKTETILIYPTAYIAQVKPSVYSQYEIAGEFARSGQTVYRGPVIVNWDELNEACQGPNDGHQLAVHEFAHQMDMINGPLADGIPPLADDIDFGNWVRSMKLELDHAREMRAEGQRIYINDYGLTSAQEFFAVGSEYFFQTPNLLAEFHPGVFQRLKEFYRVDLRPMLPT